MKDKNCVDVNVNPCKMCMPMGACLAFKGMEKSIVVMHGSQGCSTYVRRHMAQHYNEPIDIASSSLNEKATVYGGEANLKKGLKNVLKMYNPKTIGVVTTCLAETIGEDINRILKEFMVEEKISSEDLTLVSVPTPGYGGTQFEGYYLAVRKMVEKIVEPSEPNKKINIISGLMSPGDIRELKLILERFGIEAVILPDVSETLDSPYRGLEFEKLPEGGTTCSEIKTMSGSLATIEFGVHSREDHSPGEYLKKEFGVPLYRIPIPIGLENSDTLMKLLSKISGKKIPEYYVKARGRMLDAMIDSHKYNGEGVAAVFGEPELVTSISSLCLENGITPRVISTGSNIKKIRAFLAEGLDKYGDEIVVLEDTDFETIRSYVKEKEVNILIGHSDGKYIEEKEGIPLIRVGFPVHDRIGAQRQVTIGYDGSMNFLDILTNTLMAQKYQSYRDRMYKKYYKEDEDVKEVTA